MSTSGGQPGNQNAAKKPFNEQLRKAIAQDDIGRLRKVAETLLTLASQGEAWAVKELIDRTDGKAAQSVTVSGDEDNPLHVVTEIKRSIVDPHD